MPISVLYIHHAGAFGGASRSLVELIRGFPRGAVEPLVVTQRGSAASFFAATGAQVLETPGISQFDNTRFGHYRGLRWLVLLREIWYAPFTLAALLHARKLWKNVAIVHVNEVVALLAVVLAKRLFRKPVVVHVRSVQRASAGSLHARLVARVLERHASAVICIDRTVRTSLPAALPCEIVHNSFTPDALEPRRTDQQRLRVGLVGNLLPFKGALEFIEAARICRDRRLDVEFIVVGSNTRRLEGVRGRLLQAAGFARDVESELREFIDRHRLGDRVQLTGFVADVGRIYSRLDVLCFPSYLDAVGRPVYEAACYKVPGIVAMSNPQPDTFVHGETGLCIPSHDPAALADAIAYFHDRRSEVRRMGEAAYRLASEQFDARKNAERVLAIYRRLLAERP